MERQFTRQAENALKLAKTTAKTCGHGYIGTEHLLAGLLKEPEGTAGKVPSGSFRTSSCRSFERT